MMRKHKVLIVHNYYQNTGGEDAVVLNEKNMLEKHGHDVVFYSRYNSEINNMNFFSKLLIPLNSIFNLKTYLEIKKIINEQNIDLIHVHNTTVLISPAIYYAAIKCKTPVIQTVHNFRLLCPSAMLYRNGHICEDCIKNGLLNSVANKCYRNSRIQTAICVIGTTFHRFTKIYGKIYYICLSEFNKNKLLSLKQIDANRVFIKPNFVTNTASIDLNKPRNNQFIFAGRLDKLKGIETLLNAWNLMGENAPKLIICGTGPMELWCKKYIKNNHLNVTLLGFLNNNEVINLLANSKAMILPTRLYEGFPMSIVEAFSVGTPVICSNLGNAGSIVQEGVTGLKFKPDSAKELVEAINRLYDYKKINITTYEEYKNRYDENNNYSRLSYIYNKVISMSQY